MNAITNYLDKILIPEWRKAWGYWSVKWNVFVGGLAIVWASLPNDTQTAIVTGVLAIVARVIPSFSAPTSLVVIGVTVVTLYFRLKAQKKDEPAAPADPTPEQSE